jgi:hypothetical protein
MVILGGWLQCRARPEAARVPAAAKVLIATLRRAAVKVDGLRTKDLQFQKDVEA